ncbi:MAG: S-layer homology domain-containing protein [Ruminococcaceae bacterium]|nr:S-layer homology domain-containing protein [Oscillospiraceae bacterium]
MKNLKKVLALVVVFAMMMSSFAFAAVYPDVADDADYAGAIKTLSDLGFFTGDDKGNFNPDATITRAEYAVVVCRLLDLNAAGVSEFADVPASHWATGYVNAASQAGIIKGYGDGNFGPSDPVKYEEAVTMLVRALGYEPLAISKGNWPQGHISVASSYGLLTAVDGSVGEGAKRSAVAVMTYNALDIPVVEQTGFGTDVQYTIMKQTDDQDKVTLLSKLDIYKVGGIVVADAKVAYAPAESKMDKGYVAIHVTDDYDNADKYLRLEDNKNGKLDPDDNAVTLRDEKGLAAGYTATNAIAYAKKYGTNKFDLVAIEADAATTNTLVLDIADINGAACDLDADTAHGEKNVIKYYKEGASKTTTATLENVYTIVLNDEVLTNADLTAVKAMIVDESLVGNIELIDWDNDNRYDVIDITSYIHVVVEEVDAKNGVITTYNTDLDRIDLDIDNEEALVTVKDVNGADVDFATLAEYDVLAIVASPSPLLGSVNFAQAEYDSLDIITLGQSKVDGIIKGEGTTSAGDPVYTIAGNKYEYEASMMNSTDINYMENALEVSAEGTFFLGINGKIVGFEGSKASDGNYAFIIGAFATRASNATITLLSEDGKIQTYTFAEKVKFVNAGTDDYARVSIKDAATEIGAVLANTAWATFPGTGTAIWEKLDNAFDEDTTEIVANDANAKERLIQFNTNAAGEITEIIPAVTAEVNAFEKEDSLYKEATQKLDGKNLADDIVIFDIDWDDLTLSTVKDLSYLVNDSEYGAVLYNKNDDNQYEAMVVKDAESAFAVGTPLAIVTAVETGINEETDADTVTLTVVVNGAEATIVVDEEETKDADLGDFAFGTVLLYNADAAGLVDTYAVVGNITFNYEADQSITFAFDTAFEAAAVDKYNVSDETAEEDDAYFIGKYVDRTNKTLDIEVIDAIAYEDETPVSGLISLPGYANAQSYLATFQGRSKEIEIGGALTALTKCDDVTDPFYNVVIVRTNDGAVQEIIGLEFDVANILA